VVCFTGQAPLALIPLPQRKKNDSALGYPAQVAYGWAACPAEKRVISPPPPKKGRKLVIWNFEVCLAGLEPQTFECNQESVHK